MKPRAQRGWYSSVRGQRARIAAAVTSGLVLVGVIGGVALATASSMQSGPSTRA